MSSTERRIRLLDGGLLLLRVGMGLSLFFLFGLTKVKGGWNYFQTGHWQFVDFNRRIHLPFPVLVAYLQTVNESLGALLLALGLVARPAATLLAIGFLAATGSSLVARQPAWVTAAYFCLTFTSLALTGPGHWSVDRWRMRRSGQATSR